MSKKKIAVVGAGIGGIATILTLLTYGKEFGVFDICDNIIDVYYDSTKPIERVGQGSIVPFTRLFSPDTIDANFMSNKIGMTMKTGIKYEGWGNCPNFFHGFPMGFHAIHYQPNLLSQAVLDSHHVKAHDVDVSDISNIQADYIIDCRGKQYNNYEQDYDILCNPINSALLARSEERNPDLNYTRCIATPDGWTFVIPNVDSVSYGYLYNNTITQKEDATRRFQKLFKVKVNHAIEFKNYVAKNFKIADNIFLNGNRYSFIEPLEATSVGMYMYVTYGIIDCITNSSSASNVNKKLREEIKKIETFILWHYQSGSKYDTKFWRYAKSLRFNPDREFVEYLQADTYDFFPESYSQWNTFSFKLWNDNIVKS